MSFRRKILRNMLKNIVKSNKIRETWKALQEKKREMKK